MESSISWDLVLYSTEHGVAKQHKPVVIRLQYNMGSPLSILEREKESATEDMAWFLLQAMVYGHLELLAP